MALGVVPDDVFEKELENIQPRRVDTSVETAAVQQIMRGRQLGDVEVPDALRKVIGTESIENGRESAVALARDFGISPSSVSAYSAGATSTTTYNERPNGHVIRAAKERISKKARGKLLLALKNITSDKLESTNAKDLSSIAKDMSAVVKNMEPEPEKVNLGGNSGPTFIIYSPKKKEERDFEVVHTGE